MFANRFSDEFKADWEEARQGISGGYINNHSLIYGILNAIAVTVGWGWGAYLSSDGLGFGLMGIITLIAIFCGGWCAVMASGFFWWPGWGTAELVVSLIAPFTAWIFLSQGNGSLMSSDEALAEVIGVGLLIASMAPWLTVPFVYLVRKSAAWFFWQIVSLFELRDGYEYQNGK
ncbi:hypothetical protein A2191_04930 [Candidatus Woesebacteria bacterium RIFOXYA1_FULL_38_9]|nr:MAG: hypothetical protein A2191_04930 [Candidatus Woesebacteria bacterium RIFOXYA1_FULL_38_9]